MLLASILKRVFLPAVKVEQPEDKWIGEVWTRSIFGHESMKAVVSDQTEHDCATKVKLAAVDVDRRYQHPELGVYWGVRRIKPSDIQNTGMSPTS